MVSDCISLLRLFTGQQSSQCQWVHQWLETVLTVPSARIIIGNARLISLLSLSPKPHWIHPAIPRVLHPSMLCFLWREYFFLFAIRQMLYLLKSISNGTSLANFSLAPSCSSSTLPLYLAEKGIRDWKTRQDISIHQLIAWFTPWLSSIGLNQRDLECIFYFLQEGISIWDDARLPRPKMEEFSHELLQPAPRWGFAECS